MSIRFLMGNPDLPGMVKNPSEKNQVSTFSKARDCDAKKLFAIDLLLIVRPPHCYSELLLTSEYGIMETNHDCDT